MKHGLLAAFLALAAVTVSGQATSFMLDAKNIWHRLDCPLLKVQQATRILQKDIPEDAEGCQTCRPWFNLTRPEGGPKMTGPAMATIITAAIGDAKGDRSRILSAVDRRTRHVFGPVTSEPFPVSSGAETYVTLWTPYARFRLALSERVRKMEPVAATFSPNYTIGVLPGKIDGPDIIKIVVERDGQIIAPLSSTLTPTVVATRLGAKAVTHSGTVTYSAAAFAPGASVVITAIPDAGENVVVRLLPDWLIGLQ